MIPTNAKQHPIYTDYYITPEGSVWSSLSNKFLSQYNINKKQSYRCVGGKFGNKNRVLVHRLVAETFIPNPHNLTDVNHINGDKTDNSVSNLEWLSHTDNLLHAHANGLIRQPSYRYKIMIMATGETFWADRNLIGIANAFGVSYKSFLHSYKNKTTSRPIKVVERTIRGS